MIQSSAVSLVWSELLTLTSPSLPVEVPSQFGVLCGSRCVGSTLPCGNVGSKTWLGCGYSICGWLLWSRCYFGQSPVGISIQFVCGGDLYLVACHLDRFRQSWTAFGMPDLNATAPAAAYLDGVEDLRGPRPCPSPERDHRAAIPRAY